MRNAVAAAAAIAFLTVGDGRAVPVLEGVTVMRLPPAPAPPRYDAMPKERRTRRSARSSRLFSESPGDDGDDAFV